MKLIKSKHKILGFWENDEYASIVYQILNDYEPGVVRIELLPTEINFEVVTEWRN